MKFVLCNVCSALIDASVPSLFTMFINNAIDTRQETKKTVAESLSVLVSQPGGH